MSAAVQTLWARLVVSTLADAGVATCVISPGSRSTPLVAALAGESRIELVTIIDERAAAFFALGCARATGVPVAIVCTSGTAAAHYLPALVEASMAGIPLIAITADRPPELQACGASQTIDQIGLYGTFVRGAFDLGAPAASDLAFRAARRKVIQAITLALGPHPGPVHVELPLRKPLEPAAPATESERALARFVVELESAGRSATLIAPPRLEADPPALDVLAAAIEREPRGVIVAGAMPVAFAAARDAVFDLAVRAGYPILAEASSQLRFGARPSEVVMVDHADLIAADDLAAPALVIQLGAEPVAASWPAWSARAGQRWILAGHTWHDADSSARGVILGEVAPAVAALARRVSVRSELSSDSRTWLAAWREREARAAAASEDALAAHPDGEHAVMRAAIAAMPAGAQLQLGNSLPIRVIDHVVANGAGRPVLAQRGAAGIDGLVASAAGATRAGRATLLVLGDVSFVHDIGGLVAARCSTAPLAIVVVDNAGGRIFDGLPIAHTPLEGDAFARHWTTAPDVDPVAVATALGARAVLASSPAAVGAAVAAALATPGTTVIHAPVAATGARDLRRTAHELYTTPAPIARAKLGGRHD